MLSTIHIRLLYSHRLVRKPEPKVKPTPTTTFRQSLSRAGAGEDASTIRIRLLQSQPLRNAWWNVEWACLKAYPSEPNATIPANRPPA